MDNLYVWRNTLGRKQKDVPQAGDTWLSDKDSLADYKDKPVTGKWISFNPYKDKLPLDGTMRLPKKLFLFFRTKSEPVFDWFYIHHHMMAVSEVFLNYLLENNLMNQLEITELIIINVNGTIYHNKKYFAIRVVIFNDNEFNFNETTRKRAAGIRRYFLYPEIQLIKNNKTQHIYMLLEFCYNGCLILTQNAKDYIVSNFYKPEIYKLNDYHLVYNNSLHKEKLPPLINK